MHSLATLLTHILTGLRSAIAAHAARPDAESALIPWPRPAEARPPRPQPPTALFTLAWAYIGRTARRLENLIARWQTNTLPQPRAPRIRPAHPQDATKPAKLRLSPRLPRGRAWLAITAGYHTRGRASQLNHLIESPDFKDFLAAAPQAARLLRPLCHILGIAPHLALPTRPRPPRIPHPKPRQDPTRPPPTPYRPHRRPRLPPPLVSKARI